MESIELNNKELLKMIQKNINGDNEVALHNISMDAYRRKLEENDAIFNKKYKINKNCIMPIDIANSILVKGLHVPYNTLRCTTSFIGSKHSIQSQTFNYLYRQQDIFDNKIYTIVATIPSFIVIDHKKYFVGTIVNKSSEIAEPTVSTDVLFHKNLPSVFIYGFYIKKLINQTISNDLEFVINKNHISKMNLQQQSDFYKIFLKKENINFDLLEAIEQENIHYRSSNIHENLCVLNAISEKKMIKK